MARDSEAQSETGPPSGLPALMEAARGWVADCEWTETLEYGIDPAEDFTDQEIAGIDCHYEGGWAQFRRDTLLDEHRPRARRAKHEQMQPPHPVPAGYGRTRSPRCTGSSSAGAPIPPDCSATTNGPGSSGER